MLKYLCFVNYLYYDMIQWETLHLYCLHSFLTFHFNIIFFSIFTGNAAGRKTPPLLIFQGKRLPNQIKQILPNEWHCDISESGWMNSDIFYKYVSQTFYPWLQKNGISSPVVFFVDGHVSHRSLKLSEFCLQNRIILVSFLPNTTHICQPMDVAVYGPTKRKWSSNLKEFRNANVELSRLPKETFCNLLNQTVNEVCVPDLLKNAFEKTGLYPFDEENFDFSKLQQNKENEENEVECGPGHNQNHPTNDFLERLEYLIESNIPYRLQEFKNTNDEWIGDQNANDLFVIWKAAGGAASEQEDEENEHFELVEIDDANNDFEASDIDQR